MNMWALIWQDRKACTYLFTLSVIMVIGVLAPALTGDTSTAIIPYSPSEVSALSKSFQPPGFQEYDPVSKITKTHFLGTDQIGRDVFSRLLHGIRTALLVGIGSTLISLLIALLLGLCSGYFASRPPRIRLQSLLLFLPALVLILFYSREWSTVIHERQGAYVDGLIYWFLALSGIGIIAAILSYLPSFINSSIRIPVDAIILRLLEVFNSIPKLFLLLAIYSLIKTPSLLSVILIIGMLRWGGKTRLLRAEVLRIREENFVKSASFMGLSTMVTLRRHILPNVLGPLIVACSFSIGSAILVESTLSFLQIGLPLAQVSWGQMLAESRIYFSAWWLAVPPGFMIFLLILLFNSLGSRIDYLWQSKTS